MGLSSNPQARERQLDNIRKGAVSACPEKAREAGRTYGFGSGKHTQCAGTTRSGERCKSPAAYGTPKCLKHGARTYKGTPPSPNRDVMQARWWLAQNPPPRDLISHPEWLKTDTLGPRAGLLRKMALAVAWQATLNGEWALWRDLLRNSPPPKKGYDSGH